MSQLDSVRAAIQNGLGREALLDALPPGGARHALDAAMWDLEAKLSGKSVWSMVGVSDEPVETVSTIGLEEDPEAMGDKAAMTSQSLLKIKVDSDRQVARVGSIRQKIGRGSRRARVCDDRQIEGV